MHSNQQQSGNPTQGNQSYSDWAGQKFVCTIKWFDNAKGYGFAVADGCMFDVFVHYRNILSEGAEFKSLAEGEMVYLTMVQSDKGLSGVEIRKMSTLDREQRELANEGEL